MGRKIFKFLAMLPCLFLGGTLFITGALGLFLTAIPNIHLGISDIVITFVMLIGGLILMAISMNVMGILSVKSDSTPNKK